jgi:hypothetical protein
VGRGAGSEAADRVGVRRASRSQKSGRAVTTAKSAGVVLGRVVDDHHHAGGGVRRLALGVRVLAQEWRAHAEQQVVRGERGAQPRPVGGQVPGEQPVVLRETGPRPERLLPHRAVEPLRQGGEQDRGRRHGQVLGRLGPVVHRYEHQRQTASLAGGVHCPPDRAANGGAADVVGRGQFPFGRHPGAVRQGAAEDLLAQILDDLVGHPAAVQLRGVRHGHLTPQCLLDRFGPRDLGDPPRKANLPSRLVQPFRRFSKNLVTYLDTNLLGRFAE